MTVQSKTASTRPGAPIRRWIIRLIQVGVPVGLGVALVLIVGAMRGGPEPVEVTELVRPMRVIEVKRGDVVPRAIAYGLVQPDRSWKAVAQVSGRIVEKSPEVSVGTPAPTGALLLRIDPREYEIDVRELTASLKETEARLGETATKADNVERSLEVERESLEIVNRRYERTREAHQKGAANVIELDDVRRDYLAQLARIRDLENTLRSLPDERKILEATSEATTARLESARIALDNTEIRAPFDCRITSDEVELQQFVSVGQEMIAATGIATAEIVAQVALDHLKHLIPPDVGDRPLIGARLTSEAFRRLRLEATVRLRLGENEVAWEGRVHRLGAVLDSRTRTLEVVVQVADPYGQAKPGVRPPLVEEMFCEVELRGPAKPDLVLIPRTAVHGSVIHGSAIPADEVFVVREGRLARQPVALAFRLGDFVAISDGLGAGDVLIVSDPTPAIAGTRVDPVRDEALEARVVIVAAGEGNVR